ncbi:hypothetical protein [Ilumatobacter sp.]|uniref:hypothetical protein n=1 Tax=Ilumatobacter sp. TaxID=1967498 RepID=UPI003AF96DD0
MSPIVVGLLALAIVVVVVVRSVVSSRQRGPGSVELGSDRSTVWLKQAGDTARRGRELAADLERPIQCGGSSVAVAPELHQRIDALTHQLAELATSAPTSMDVRVCRGVAVSSQALGSALGSDDDPDEISGRRPVGRQELLDRYARFVMALGDLERHVELL